MKLPTRVLSRDHFPIFVSFVPTSERKREKERMNRLTRLDYEWTNEILRWNVAIVKHSSHLDTPTSDLSLSPLRRTATLPSRFTPFPSLDAIARVHNAREETGRKCYSSERRAFSSWLFPHVAPHRRETSDVRSRARLSQDWRLSSSLSSILYAPCQRVRNGSRFALSAENAGETRARRESRIGFQFRGAPYVIVTYSARKCPVRPANETRRVNLAFRSRVAEPWRCARSHLGIYRAVT